MIYVFGVVTQPTGILLQVCRFACNADFRHLGSAFERILEEMASVRRADLLKLASFLENHLASTDIDGKGYDDDKPYGAIENRNSQGVPWQRDPAPQL